MVRLVGGILTSDLAHHYWYLDFLKRHGFVRNNKRDEIFNNMMLKATKIKEEDVIFSSNPNGLIIVRDHSHGHEVNYFVSDPSSEWALCSCAKVGQANICKHVLRVF